MHGISHACIHVTSAGHLNGSCHACMGARMSPVAAKLMAPTMPRSPTASSACSADDDFLNLQNTTPLLAMRSVLQYSRSTNWLKSSCKIRNSRACLGAFTIRFLSRNGQ